MVGGGFSSLLRALSEEQYYVSEPAAMDALRRQGQPNIIDMETGWKVKEGWACSATTPAPLPGRRQVQSLYNTVPEHFQNPTIRCPRWLSF